jgi:hypothetical protein
MLCDVCWVGRRTSFSIALETQHDLRRPVPSRRHIFGHVSRIFFRIHAETSGQPEIGNLQLTIGIHQQVAGLEVAMQDVGAVDVLQAAQDLIDEGLEVGIGERLAGADNGREIALHELCVVT